VTLVKSLRRAAPAPFAVGDDRPIQIGPVLCDATMDDQLRRRAVGAPATRSVLLTMLGEYVLPTSGGVWQEALINGLCDLDYKVHAARQALARSVRAGWLRTERHGRRSRVFLTPETSEMLRSGAERIYSFGKPRQWDGRWFLLMVHVPEERRRVRHQVRTRLAWAGFGSLGGGLWISPNSNREPELGDLSANGSVAELLSFHAELGDLGDARQLVSRAWDLDAVADEYRRFTVRFSRMRPKSAEAVFKAQTMLVHEWRRFPFLDPDLPASTLPRAWPRERAHSVFVQRHAAWHEIAQEHFRSLERAASVPAARRAAKAS
jgi:phenylacetic acid degradation operon negative regulatory protein